MYYNQFKKYFKNFGIKKHGVFFKKSNKADCRLLGINSRLDAIQAIVLNEKLKRLNHLTKKRKNISNIYNKKINNPKNKKLTYEKGSVNHQYVIKAKDRKKFISYLKSNKISYGIHYPVSINNLKIIKKFAKKKFPNAEILSKQCISIPIDPYLKKNEINKIIKVINLY